MIRRLIPIIAAGLLAGCYPTTPVLVVVDPDSNGCGSNGCEPPPPVVELDSNGCGSNGCPPPPVTVPRPPVDQCGTNGSPTNCPNDA